MGAIMAALIMAVIPVIIFYLACQKYIIEGVAAGAVKGLELYAEILLRNVSAKQTDILYQDSQTDIESDT